MGRNLYMKLQRLALILRMGAARLARHEMQKTRFCFADRTTAGFQAILEQGASIMERVRMKFKRFTDRLVDCMARKESQIHPTEGTS